MVMGVLLLALGINGLIRGVIFSACVASGDSLAEDFRGAGLSGCSGVFDAIGDSMG